MEECRKKVSYGLAQARLERNTFTLAPSAGTERDKAPGFPDSITSNDWRPEQLAVIQDYVDSLEFETVELEEWIGDDLPRAMAAPYCDLLVDLPQYYLEISPWHPQMAEVRVIQRATLQYNADDWTAYCRADEQNSQALLALFGLRFEDWEGTFASHFLEESAADAAGAALEVAEAIR